MKHDRERKTVIFRTNEWVTYLLLFSNIEAKIFPHCSSVFLYPLNDVFFYLFPWKEFCRYFPFKKYVVPYLIHSSSITWQMKGQYVFEFIELNKKEKNKQIIDGNHRTCLRLYLCTFTFSFLLFDRAECLAHEKGSVLSKRTKDRCCHVCYYIRSVIITIYLHESDEEEENIPIWNYAVGESCAFLFIKCKWISIDWNFFIPK